MTTARPLGLAGAALALLVASPAAAAPARQEKAFAYRVVSLSATSRLDYRGGDGLVFAQGRALATARLARLPRGRMARVSLSASGGRVLAPLVVTHSELRAVSRRTGRGDPYREPTVCRRARKAKGRGGLLLRRAGSRFQVRWTFPLAWPAFCAPPGSLGRPPVARMTARIPARRLGARRLTLSLSGTTRIGHRPYAATYRWRAKVTLARR